MKRLKKSLCLLLALTLIAGAFAVSGFAADPFSPGDVSGDGSVTAEDARLALRAAVGLEVYEEGSAQFRAADATKDGVITAEDARLILRVAVGLENLPADVEEPQDRAKEEIAACLTAAVNQTREYTGDVTVEHSETFSSMNITKCPGGSLGISLANKVAAGVLRPANETLKFSGGMAVNSDGESVPLLLPETGAFALPADGIAAASIKNEDGKTVIGITLVEEAVSRSEVPPYNAGAIGYLKSDDVDLSILTIDRVDVVYPGSVITAVINADGYVEQITYRIPIQIDASGSAMGMISGDFACDGVQEETWKLNW